MDPTSRESDESAKKARRASGKGARTSRSAPAADAPDAGSAPAPAARSDVARPADAPANPAEQAYSLLVRGELKFRQQNYLEAESTLRRAVRLYGELPDADAAEHLRALDALAAVALARGDLAHADAVLRDALKLAESIFGTEHEELARYLNQLAHVLFKRRQFAQAEPFLARLVAIKRRLGDEHPEVASVVASLALVHEALHRWESAESLWSCVLAIRERSLPGDSPAIAMACEHLADARAALGLPADAVALRERALDIRERTRPAGDPQIIAARAKLTTLRMESAKAPIPVVVPHARMPEPRGAAQAYSPTIARPPQRPARREQAPAPGPTPRPAASHSATAAAPVMIPQDVLDEIIRGSTGQTSAAGLTRGPGAPGKMADVKDRARRFLERPLLKLVKPARAMPADLPYDAEEETFEAAVAGAPATRPVPRPTPVITMSQPSRLADSPPLLPANEEWDEDFDDDEDHSHFDSRPRGRFDLFGDENWPRTRIAIGILAVVMLIVTSVLVVNRRAAARAAEPVAASTGAEQAPAQQDLTTPAPVTDDRADAQAPQTRSAVPAQTVRELNAALKAMDSAAARRAAESRTPARTPEL